MGSQIVHRPGSAARAGTWLVPRSKVPCHSRLSQPAANELPAFHRSCAALGNLSLADWSQVRKELLAHRGRR